MSSRKEEFGLKTLGVSRSDDHPECSTRFRQTLLERLLVHCSKRSWELHGLRIDRNKIEKERVKMASELSKLQDGHTATCSELAETKEELRFTAESLRHAQQEFQALRVEHSQLNQKVDRLISDATNTSVNTKTLERKLRKEQRRLARLQGAYEELNVQISHITGETTAAHTLATTKPGSRLGLTSATKDTIASLRNLRQKYDDVVEDYEDSQSRLEALEKLQQHLEGRRHTAEKKLVVVEAESKRKSQDIEMLRKAKADMEKTRDLVAPILKIGVDIRLRNLQWTRLKVFHIPPGSIGKAITLNGNAAAHCANGAVDAAMFVAGLVPENFVEEARETFEKMYSMTPLLYGSSSPKALRLIDCQATVMTAKGHFRKKTPFCGKLLALHKEYLKLENWVLRRSGRGSSNGFKEDDKLEEILNQMKDLSEGIADTARNKRVTYSKKFRPFVSLVSCCADTHLLIRSRTM